MNNDIRFNFTLIGNVGRHDAEVRRVGASQVVSFSMAFSEKITPKNGDAYDKTTWFNCAYWMGGETNAEGLASAITAGRQIAVRIRSIEADAYTDQNGEAKASLKATIDSIDLSVGRSERTGNKTAKSSSASYGNVSTKSAPKKAAPKPPSNEHLDEPFEDSDDVPF